MNQRAVSSDQIAYTMLNGKVYDRAGARWYVLRWKDVPETDRKIRLQDKAVGLVVCVVDDEVATVYKRERPSLYIRKKPKFSRQRSDQRCRKTFGTHPQDNLRDEAA